MHIKSQGHWPSAWLDGCVRMGSACRPFITAALQSASAGPSARRSAAWRLDRCIHLCSLYLGRPEEPAGTDKSGWLRTFVTSIVLVASSVPHAKLCKLLYSILKTFKNNGLGVEIVNLKKMWLSGRSDGLVVKSNVCSSRGSKYNPHQPQGGSQPPAVGSNALFRFVWRHL